MVGKGSHHPKGFPGGPPCQVSIKYFASTNFFAPPKTFIGHSPKPVTPKGLPRRSPMPSDSSKSHQHPTGFPGGPPCPVIHQKARDTQRASQAVPHGQGLRTKPSTASWHLTGIEPAYQKWYSKKGRTNRSNAGKISVDRSTRLLSHLQYPDSTKSSAKDLSKQHRNL